MPSSMKSWRRPWNSSMYERTRGLSGIGMSWFAVSRSVWTTSFNSGGATGVPSAADRARRSSIDAVSYFFSVKPSPVARARTS